MRVGATRGCVRRVAVSMLLAGMLATLGPAHVALGSVSCNPGRSHDTAARYVITTGAVSGINGLNAKILELDPYYSGYNGTGTNSTIMLTNTSMSQWAQLGWFKSKIHTGSVTREAGLEFYLDASHNYYQWFGSRAVQTQTQYQILFESGQRFNFFVGGSYVASYSGFTPAGYQMFSETHDLADQMPGMSSNVETFKESVYWTGAGHGTQHWISGSISYDSRYYGGQHPGAGTYYAWDKCGLPASVDAAAAAASSQAQSQPGGERSAVLTGDYMGLFGIVSAEDATTATAGSLVALGSGFAITRDKALGIAASELAVGADSRIYAGKASRSPGSAAQPVWIITAPGGTPPFDGPAGAPPVPAPRLSGVIIDASTGDIWSGFMH